MRLNKYLASSGLGSRRACEQLIADGIVTINGEPAQGPFQQVDPARDRVAVAGETVRPPKHPIYVMLHKPAGYITTVKDPESRRTVMSLLPKTAERLFPVGRLDRDSEGLLLFTSDGETANRLAHPRYGIQRFYRVEVNLPFPASKLRDLERGVFVEGELLAVAKARLDPPRDQGKRLELVLVTGKKREIRRLLQAMGFAVTRILRYGFGSLRLGDLPLGKTRRLSPAEIRQLKEIVGIRD
ncbi:rRNA pseudouridine synthase [Candidatus Fermentibacteria bacterium]|nr:rRNA pseudouridine synthase [Candidatus Fermentibacteria bacterium]